MQAEAAAGRSEGAGLALRLFWMGLGNILLIICLLLVVSRDLPLLSWIDIGYFLILIPSIIAARYVDITRFGGQTTNGEPATMRHWARHSVGLVAVCILLRIGAHLLMSYV